MEDKESSKNGYQLNGEGHIQSGQGQVKQKDTAAQEVVLEGSEEVDI